MLQAAARQDKLDKMVIMLYGIRAQGQKTCTASKGFEKKHCYTGLEPTLRSSI